LEFWSPLSLPCYIYPAGVNVSLAAAVKKAVGVPVVAAGKIDPVLGERILQEGKADFIALGRPLLADPYLPNKAREGRLRDIRSCIYCNNCLVYTKRRIRSCTVNPFLFRESEYPPTPASAKKKVVVIGGGLAGIQAAAVLGQRGHDVSLYESEKKLGGQWKVASTLKAKQSYATFVDYLSKSLSQVKIEVHTETKVTKELVLQLKPDAVVLATGAVPLTLKVPGAKGKNVVQANDVIMGQVELGPKVVVLGGRFLGMEMAIDLAERGKEVVLVSRSRISGKKRPIERHTYKALMRRLIELRVPLYPNCSVIEITAKGVYVEHNEGAFLLEADTVVLAVGTKSQNSLATELKGVVAELYQVGDCVEPEDAATATYEATRVALQI
jgi:NADPH-dependent 2,4-dienoyl-CoA reductase/sulfur reductase-like enzyme